MAGLGLDAADAPAEDAEPVDHRRVRVGADERVGIGDRVAVALGGLHDLREELEVHLVDDAGAGRDDAEVAERLLRPAEEGVALAVALVLAVDVDAEGVGHAEGVDLDRVVDDEVDGEQGVHALRVDAASMRLGAQRGEVGDDGDAGEVLEEDAGGQEGKLSRRERAGRPGGEGADVVLGDDCAVEAAEEVLEEDADGERQAIGCR